MSNNLKCWLVGVGAIVMALATVLSCATTLSLYVVPLCEGLGVSRTEVSLMFSISSFAAIFGALSIGPLLKVVKTKFVAALGGVFALAFFMTISFAQSMIPIYIAVVFKGLAGTYAGMAMAQIVIAQWFDKARGTVMSFVSIATGVFGAVSVTAMSIILSQFGYRTVAFWEAIIFGAVIIVFSLLFLDDAPQKIGYLPFGQKQKEEELDVEAAKEGIPDREEPALGLKRIMKFPAFWVILIVTLLAAFTSSLFNAHGVAYFMSMGLDSVTAATAFSAYQLAAIPWNLLFGVVSDKKSAGVATAINGILFAIVCAFAFVWSGFFGAIMVAIFYAAGGTISTLAGSLLTTRLFGTKEAGSMVGIVRAFSAAGSMCGPILAGLMYDMTQSYVACFEIMAVFGVIIVVATLWADGKGTKAKVQAAMDDIRKRQLKS